MARKAWNIHLKEKMDVDQNSAHIDGVDPFVQIPDNTPQALHYKLDVFAVGVVTTNRIVQ